MFGLRSVEEDQHDKHDVDDDVHQPAVGVHPVAHLRHYLLRAPAKQQVREHRKRRYKDGCRDERYSAKKRGVLLREVYSDGHKNDEVGREHREQQQPGSERRPGLAFCRAPSHLGGSLVSRPT